jgi:hypothetical protein
LKENSLAWLEALKGRFVFTPEEKRVIVFVLVMLMLGLGAKNFRDARPAGRAELENKGTPAQPRTISATPRGPRQKIAGAGKTSPAPDNSSSGPSSNISPE